MKWFKHILIGTLLVLSSAGAALAVDIDTNFPGGTHPTSEPGGVIANFYQFALLVGGILAFGVIVYGGIKYTLAAGNPSGQSDGKEWIKGALLGLLLLVGAYLVLNTINPNLTNLKLPTLEAVQATPTATCGGTKPGTCADSMQECINCPDPNTGVGPLYYCEKKGVGCPSGK